MQNGIPFEANAIILNSIGCLALAIPYIKNYRYKMRFRGETTIKVLKLPDHYLTSSIHYAKNRLYGAYKLPNEWYVQQAMGRLRLSLICVN